MLDKRRAPRVDAGGPPIVERPLPSKASDRSLHRFWIELLTEKTVTQLGRRQFAPGEQRQACGVRIRGQGRSYTPKRSTSGAPPVPVSDCAIWSRVMSDVLPIPCTRSVNSLTFETQRMGSSSVIRLLSYSAKIAWSNVCMPYWEVPCAIAPWI